MNKTELLEVMQEQAEAGVGIFTIHLTPTFNLLELSNKRIIKCTSRGGSLIVKDLIKKEKEQNIYLDILPDIIKIAKRHKIVLSLGTTFRSANIFDTFDDLHKKEMRLQLKFADLISQNNIGVILELPGHARMSDIFNIAKFIHSVKYPIMPLGPIPTDIAINLDHVASAIGASIFGMFNCVDIIASVTREEHSGGIPSIKSSLEALQISNLVTHIIDIDKINSVKDDYNITLNRKKNKSCNIDSDFSGCSRCSIKCPLI